MISPVFLILLVISLFVPHPKITMSTNAIPHQKIKQIVNSTIDNKMVYGTVLHLSRNNESETFAAGNFKETDSYFIASTTKLFVTAITMNLRSKGLLNLDDPISKFIDAEEVNKLVVYKGIDYSNTITIRHLLSQTSGIPDYFEEKKENGTSLVQEICAGNDKAWTYLETLEMSKKMKPTFQPGAKGKAGYSDTNYQLLGNIISNITGMPVSKAIDTMICEPLRLKSTYIFSNISDTIPKHLYFKKNELKIPLAMSSFGADGGIVSTAQDCDIFLKAFFSGVLFPKEYLMEMYQWNKIFFPLEYGVGLMRFKLPWFFSPFKSLPVLYGHSGLSGAFAFYCPEKNLYISGTVNQISNPDISYKLLIKVLNEIN